MEKYMSTPVRNFEVEPRKILMEKHTPKQSDVEGELEIINQKVNKKSKIAAQILENRNVKIKKLKVKISRAEKRKLSEKLDSKKYKRKKKEEKSGVGSGSSVNNINEEDEIIEILPNENNVSFMPECRSELKVNSTPVENNSDVENPGKLVKQKNPKKSKAVARKCKETLDILLSLDMDVLDSLNKSLKLIKNLNLLNDNYISIDTFLDLISLAMDINRVPDIMDCEKGLSLSTIITKCIDKLQLTPKQPKVRQSIITEPLNAENKPFIQEETPLTVVSKEDTLENQNEEEMELCETVRSGEILEKPQELTIQKSGSNFCITNYFKKLKRTVEEKDKNERFSCFSAKTDMFLAPKLGGELIGERRQKFEEEFNRQNYEFNSIVEHIRKYKLDKKSHNTRQEDSIQYDAEDAKELTSHNAVKKIVKNFSKNGTETVEIANSSVCKRVSLIRVDKAKAEPIETLCRAKAKLLQFHDNRRPPYWGTWRRKSESVKPRRPFGKEKMFNYEIDSDDEWEEEEEEPGESLHGSDDEKEPEEDYEVDNEFFVPHGYLSDDENPEKENLSPKTKLNLLEEQFTSEQKQKMRKMAPIVFGTFWAYKGLSSEGNLYQDLQIDKLQYVPWTSIPVGIEEEDEKKSDSSHDQRESTSQTKKSKQKIFPNEEIPNLIKMIHGSPQNSDRLARKFLLYWKTEKISNGNCPEPTKICVQKKIKELAAWQESHEKGKMCWQVPKETIKEFGAEVENKTPEKKPRKCFIWKFVRKAEKNPLPIVENPSTPAAVVEPEVIVLES